MLVGGGREAGVAAGPENFIVVRRVAIFLPASTRQNNTNEIIMHENRRWGAMHVSFFIWIKA